MCLSGEWKIPKGQHAGAVTGGLHSALPWARGFPGGSVLMNSPANARVAGGAGSIPGLRRFPRRRKWQPAPVFLPGESHGQRSLAGHSQGDHKEWDTTEHVYTPIPPLPWVGVDSEGFLNLKFCHSVSTGQNWTHASGNTASVSNVSQVSESVNFMEILSDLESMACFRACVQGEVSSGSGDVGCEENRELKDVSPHLGAHSVWILSPGVGML